MKLFFFAILLSSSLVSAQMLTEDDIRQKYNALSPGGKHIVSAVGWGALASLPIWMLCGMLRERNKFDPIGVIQQVGPFAAVPLFFFVKNVIGAIREYNKSMWQSDKL